MDKAESYRRRIEHLEDQLEHLEDQLSQNLRVKTVVIESPNGNLRMLEILRVHTTSSGTYIRVR